MSRTMTAIMFTLWGVIFLAGGFVLGYHDAHPTFQLQCSNEVAPPRPAVPAAVGGFRRYMPVKPA